MRYKLFIWSENNMNEENKREFIFRCREFLSAQSLASLRSYGREVGVVSPTSRKKGELIEEIIGVLSNEIPAQARSGRGAPVLDDRPDVKIVQEIERLKAKYDAPTATGTGYGIPDYHFEERLKELRKNQTIFVLNSNAHVDCNADGTPRVFRGQMATHDDVSFLIPLDYMKDEEKLLLPIDFIRSYGLKDGDVISCYAKKNENIAIVMKILDVNGCEPAYLKRNGNFDGLNVRYPVGKIKVYDTDVSSSITAKYMDWVVPFGRGQRALIVAPPKTGKTQFLEKVACGGAKLNADVTTLVLLIDQSPETVAQFRKVIDKDCLAYATYEDEPERQVFVAESMLKRAKRLAECGKDVLLIVDSLNALARAYNETEESSGGKMLPCGLESKTVHYIKKYFGAARCLEVGGSLTVVGTVSNATGNPADDLLATELSAICNLQIQLKESLAAKRIFPALGTDSVYVKHNEGEGRGEPETLVLLRRAKPERFGDVELITLLENSSSLQEFNEKLRKFSK